MICVKKMVGSSPPCDPPRRPAAAAIFTLAPRSARSADRTTRRDESGLLRVTRAPALGVDRLAGEQLARTVAGRAARVEIAVRAFLSGLMRRRRLRRVLGVVQRLGGRI